MTKKDTAALLGCYMLWGFQPLYWGLIGDVGTMTVMPLRIVFAALFSVLILALQKRTAELKALFKDRKIMKFLLPAALFLLADWTVYIILVNSGHIIDVSLGYYINPLLLFLIGALIYREKCGAGHFIALAVAVMGVVVSAAAFGFGFKGGEIVPTMFIGAALGCTAGPLLGIPPQFAAAIALVAVFCGAVNCPIASIILSVELFGSGELLYFALACGISYMLSGYFGLYSSQKIMYSKTRAEFINRYAE